MKSFTSFLASPLFTLATVHGQQSATDEVNAVRSRYKIEFDQLAAAEAATLAPVAATYAKELTRLKEAGQTKGDLKTVLDLNAFIAAVNTGSVEAPPESANAGLRTAYTNYERNKATALRPLASKRQQLEGGYTRALTALEQQYTRSGQIDAAKLAHDAKANDPSAEYEVISNMSGAVLNGSALKSEKTYKPPVEIEWRLETDGEVRLAYACDQLIFNWSNIPADLRIDGGPVSRQHKKGAGAAPTKRPIAIKVTVLAKQMTVSLDGHERARWKGDFSAVDQQVGIRADGGSTVKVDQVKVRKLK